MDKLIEYVFEHRNFFEEMDSDTYHAAEVLLNANAKLKKLLNKNFSEGGELNMCQALEDLQKYGEKIGEKRGEKRGEKKGDALRLLEQIKSKVKKNKDIDVIADELEDTVDNLKPLYDAVMECGPDKEAKDIYKYYSNLNKGCEKESVQ